MDISITHNVIHFTLLVYIIWLQSHHNRERGDLVSRLMSRSFDEYARHEEVKQQKRVQIHKPNPRKDLVEL